MKKLYLFLLTVVIGVIAGYLWLFNSNSDFISKNNNESFKYEESKKADKPNEFTKYFKAITTKFGEENSNYPSNYRVNELFNAKTKAKKYNSKASTITWNQRGPANIGGRTRGLIIDPDDPNNDTWFAGSATGGIWKTEDRGQTWICLTDDFPNLSANTLAMAESNHDIIYAGTGESLGGSHLQGSGIFKSIDRGVTWTQLVNTTTEDFEFVNRLAVDNTNENIIVAATESGIMKSIDGGAIWTKVYTSLNGIEDLKADPNDFNKLYATENGVGVVLSTDAGDNWSRSNNGLEQGKRYELAISPVNTAKIYLSIESAGSKAYRSIDYGVTWEKFKDTDGVDDDFLGGQGWYDNIITAHPYDEDVAFLGGVNLYKIDYSDPGTMSQTDASVNRIDLVNTQSFLSFINFTGSYLDGGMELGTENEATNLSESDFVSVEIRFGTDMSQMAHRFTVGGQGSGVAPSGYIYEDYVEVPFEVWDVTNNKQLMASFRDQGENGIFDLVARIEEDPTVGREYLFVNAVDYDPINPSTDIAQDAGHSYKQLYFFWPTLAEEGTWDANSLPDSKIFIGYFSIAEKTGTSTVVSDAYGSGNNSYSQSAGYGTTKIPGLHPDHHNLIMIKTDEANEKFIVINANDGGLAISENEGITFNQLPNNYITTQFYGVAKRSGVNEYIGGMQDNGTWATPAGENSSETTDYIFHLGGDGFECIWHPNDADKMIGSVYYNSFRRSLNGGTSWPWAGAYSGIETVTVFEEETRLDGPFVTHISYNKNNPDVLFAVGYNGIYKSTNFASSWNKIIINEGWNSDYWLENYYTSSQHNIEVSLANENIVWAGAAMTIAETAEDFNWNIFVSTDQGETFNAVTGFTGGDLSGFISGIATHPYEDSTAYILFSFAEEPKVLRTKDLGQTWEDLSGFVGNTTSDNGFPDVVTHCLVVLPNESSTIWVGTDIGIFESIDDGATWNYINSDLPAVSVYDMFVQDGQVVIATHGRGIWTATIEELNFIPELNGEYSGNQTMSAIYNLMSDVDSIELYLDDEYKSTVSNVQAGTDTIKTSVTAEGEYSIQLISYVNSNPYYSNFSNVVADFSPVISNLAKGTGNTIEITANLNENYDSLQITLNDAYAKSITSFDSGENEFLVEYITSGTQKIIITGYLFGTGYESVADDIYLTYVGISDLKVNSLNVYPNPTKGNITIELPENFNDEYNIDVYSLSGAKVLTKLINKNNNSINLENLNNGLYIIRLENNGEIYSQKIKIRK